MNAHDATLANATMAVILPVTDDPKRITMHLGIIKTELTKVDLRNRHVAGLAQAAQALVEAYPSRKATGSNTWARAVLDARSALVWFVEWRLGELLERQSDDRAA
jgi:hypothetical protein